MIDKRRKQKRLLNILIHDQVKKLLNIKGDLEKHQNKWVGFLVS